MKAKKLTDRAKARRRAAAEQAKAVSAKFERDTAVAQARHEEQARQQNHADMQFLSELRRVIDAANDFPTGTVVTACVHVNGGYRDIKIPMASLCHLSHVIRRLQDRPLA